jgi:hypothetical protein
VFQGFAFDDLSARAFYRSRSSSTHEHEAVGWIANCIDHLFG